MYHIKIMLSNIFLQKGCDMLRLSKITKDYKMAGMEVNALKGIDLVFRESEFVSVLGPSGCGKTTLLNIIGGLDKYTAGDLFINGRSTKEFSDKDWDVYRNRKVGFVFQSYNLIPHQTILGNVELALTIGGIGKAERTEKAKAALDKVGLSGMYTKRPNQLSGGQCQRVAIARALVNDPEILLADEPTGALDSVTSLQIMEIIKEIASEKLVIMVTHNGELAEQYSTRTIRLLDGKLQSDSNPYTEKEITATDKKAKTKHKKEVVKGEPKQKVKAKMSLWTAFKLSLQNLFSKKARTIMTSIAGSIGIIGVSLVLSMSYGVQSFINNMQNDMLSGNPVKISKSGYDLSSMLGSMSFGEKAAVLKENGYVNVDSLMEYFASQATSGGMNVSNEITQEYVDYVLGIPSKDAAAVFLDYGLNITNNLYTDFYADSAAPAQNLSISAIRTLYTSILNKTPYSDFSDLIPLVSKTFAQAPANEDYILSQYNKVTGEIADEANEVMIVLDSGSMLTDLLLAQLGYYTQEEFVNLIYKFAEMPAYDESLMKDKFSYTELLGKSFTWYPNDTVFNETPSSNPLAAINPFTYNHESSAFSPGMELTVVGILEPKASVAYGCLESGFYYTEALAEHIIQQNMLSEIIAHMETNNKDSIVSMEYSGVPAGITYNYSYDFEGTTYNEVGYVGSTNMMSAMLGMIGMGGGEDYYTVSKQQLGGVDLAYEISIYPVNFQTKDRVVEYLEKWNSNKDIVVNGVTLTPADRQHITYTDNLSVIFGLINSMIDVITYALVGFTALALLVSCVMIGIITYVSVVERTKEIGVIRSLGGRKRDVSYLFNAETIIIGLVSGVIGVGMTYILSGVINLIVGSLSSVGNIALFPWNYALIMLGISVLLTLVSGLIPSRSAAKKDPAVALRTE